MVAAFADAGIDLTQADLFVGTSAGSVIGSMLAHGRKPLDELNRAIDVKPDSTYAASVGDNLQQLMAAMAKASEMEPEERLKELGRLSREADVVPEETFVESFAYLDADGSWPPRFICTAIDTEDASFVTWSESSGVDPIRAIASSCSVPGFFPPITINGRRYMDGGMRSLTNADLAAGNERVLILTLFVPSPEMTDPRAVRVRQILEGEQKAIADRGGESLVFAPDVPFGPNLMDPSKVDEAKTGGYEQGTRLAERVAAFWNPA